MKPATLIDIARKAGVAPSTVSRALNDRPDVSAVTKKLIKSIAEKYNFKLNPIAQGLKTKSTKIIGVIVPEIKHDFFSSAISGIQEAAYKAGYSIILSQSNENYEREKASVELLVNQRVAGILVSVSQETKEGSHFSSVLEKNVPLVFFDRVCGDVKTGKVVVDDEKGAFEAVEYLINKGYKRIAHISGKKSLDICLKRLNGYKKALKKYGFEIEKDLIVTGGLHENEGYEATTTLLSLKNKPDAIFAVNDPAAIGAYLKLKESGYDIPGDIAVMGFSNDRIAELVYPKMTTVNQNSFELGKRAAEMLIARIENKGEGIYETVVLETNLIIRESA
jgi:LacI family transcriptional regulator